jgi:hypothetical protein
MIGVKRRRGGAASGEPSRRNGRRALRPGGRAPSARVRRDGFAKPRARR